MNKSILFGIASLALCFPPGARAQQSMQSDAQINARVEQMLGKMTPAQKIDLIGGEDDMFIRAVPEIGFPRLKMSDGPLGVRTWGPSTAYAAGAALAASWDPELAQRVGASLGMDARARGVNFLLGPGVNIYRAPMNGRNFEYFGEDPYLASRIAASYIEGVQSEGVIATVKHYAANNSEYDRHNINSVVDERTLRELYLPAFEAAVKEAKAGAVMDSYNLLNGEHMTQNRRMNVDILRKEWGFDGIVMSDWDATYDGVAAANGGLDLEMPSGKFMNQKTLLPAIQSGAVSKATIDEKVRRILHTSLRFGFLDRDQLDLQDPLYSQHGDEIALASARASLTMLKNDGGLLPLNAERVKTIAIIGPDAYPAVVGGGGSSDTTAFAPVSFLSGVSDYLGRRTKVIYASGLPSLEDIFKQTRFKDANGNSTLKMEVFDNPEFSGTAANSTPRNVAGWKASMWTPPAQKPKGVRWSGSYMPEKSGKYLFLVAAGGEDVWKLTVDGKQVLEQSKSEGHAPRGTELDLQAGKTVEVQLDYMPSSDVLRIGFGIHAVADLVSEDAKKIAASADAVLIPVGFNTATESEGFDRTFELPWGQDALIQAIAAANNNVIVTVTSGGGVDMEPWLRAVPVVLQNWYPGQAGGKAMAEVLFGERAPEGHLPMSFQKAWTENPVHDHYYPEKGTQPPTVKYAEGVFVGYRYYTSENKHPLFPFGYGLTYTNFRYGHLKVSPKQSGGDTPVTVTFDVTNVGTRAGAAVAQLYVGDPSAKVNRPVKELKGFKKVMLQPGDTQQVSLSLDKRALSYWSDAEHHWQVDPGQFTVYVGDSSENTPLTAEFDRAR
ncbi:MAG: beta-glucosidase H [Acidobacteriaceae bacterium]